MSSKLEELDAWTSADRLVADSLGEWFGAPVATSPATLQSWHPEFAAELPLTSTAAQRRLWVVLQSDAASLQALCETLFGCGRQDVNLLEDLLREATNVAAGAIKAAALEEGLTFTTGLPNSVAPNVSRDAPTVKRFSMELTCQSTRVRIAVLLCSHSAASQARCVESLRDGMVIAREVSDGDGAVLAHAGTRLTSSNVSLITERLGAGDLVEVAVEA